MRHLLWTGRYPSAQTGPLDDCSKWQELAECFETILIESTKDDPKTLLDDAMRRRHNNPPMGYVWMVNLQKLEERGENSNGLLEKLSGIDWFRGIIDESGVGGDTENTKALMAAVGIDKIIHLDGSDYETIITRCTKENSTIFLEEEELEAMKRGECPFSPAMVTITTPKSSLTGSEYDDTSRHFTVLLETHGHREQARFVETQKVADKLWEILGKPGVFNQNFTIQSLGLSLYTKHLLSDGINTGYAWREQIQSVINPALPDGEKLWPVVLDEINGSPVEREAEVTQIIERVANPHNKDYTPYGSVIILGDSKLIRGAGVPVVIINAGNGRSASDQAQTHREQNIPVEKCLKHPILSPLNHKGEMLPVMVYFDLDHERPYELAYDYAVTIKHIAKINGENTDSPDFVKRALESRRIFENSPVGGRPLEATSTRVIERVKGISRANDFVRGPINTENFTRDELMGVSAFDNSDVENERSSDPQTKQKKSKKGTKNKAEVGLERMVRTILGQIALLIQARPDISTIDDLCSEQNLKDVYERVKPHQSKRSLSKHGPSKFTTATIEKIFRQADPRLGEKIICFRNKINNGLVNEEDVRRVSMVKKNANIPLPLDVAREMVSCVV
jgi:hypothetical protein